MKTNTPRGGVGRNTSERVHTVVGRNKGKTAITIFVLGVSFTMAMAMTTDVALFVSFAVVETLPLAR